LTCLLRSEDRKNKTEPFLIHLITNVTCNRKIHRSKNLAETKLPETDGTVRNGSNPNDRRLRISSKTSTMSKNNFIPAPKSNSSQMPLSLTKNKGQGQKTATNLGPGNQRQFVATGRFLGPSDVFVKPKNSKMLKNFRFNQLHTTISSGPDR